jgi:hypothetical protein
MKQIKLALAVLALCVLMAGSGYVIAAYIMTSNAVTVTVVASASLSLSTSSSSITQGEAITLTAVISDQRNGVVISFYDHETEPVGQATTAGGGIATLALTPSAGSHSYTATGLHP